MTEGSFELPWAGWELVKKGEHLYLLVDASKDEVLAILSRHKREVGERTLMRPSLVAFSSRLSYWSATVAHLRTRGLPDHLHGETQNGQEAL